MKKLLLLSIVFIVGCEKDTVAPNPFTCDGLTEVELWGECYNIEETTSLYLSISELTREIPVEIGNLENLMYLYLSYNQLTGEIPQQVCDLIESNNLYMYYILTGNNLINTCD